MNSRPLTSVLGSIPNRLQLAGGWIDQPFISRLNPRPPGAMVVVALQPTFRVMDRSGCASGTRAIATRLWHGRLPARPPAELARELYRAENENKSDPSGSQDMIGLVYPGINRLDYDFSVEAGVFPAHIESLVDPATAAWLENVLHLLPVEPRPDGYSPLGEKNLDPAWIARLGQSGHHCFDAVRRHDIRALGASLNETMACWQTLLPQTVRHPLLKPELPDLLHAYQEEFPGAMFSGCGGGYLLVASDHPVPGSLRVSISVK